MGAREEEARKVTESETKEWHADFEAAQGRPLEIRLKYAFIRTCKPVLDDGGVRVFDTMKEYREWCNALDIAMREGRDDAADALRGCKTNRASLSEQRRRRTKAHDVVP